MPDPVPAPSDRPGSQRPYPDHWPVCDARGCFQRVAQSGEASRHYGTRAMPQFIMLDGDRYFLCVEHLRSVRAWLSSRTAVA